MQKLFAQLLDITQFDLNIMDLYFSYYFDLNLVDFYFNLLLMACIRFFLQTHYSHLFNKRGGGAKVAKLLNVELGIYVEGGIFGKN